MNYVNRHYFTLQELLTAAMLAALGGVTSSALSIVRAVVHTVVGLPFGLQFMAGIHVLWLVLAVGLIRKPGSATATGLLKGAVELFTGNPHGLLVFAYSGFAGLAVDLAWLLLARRHCLVTYVVAGGAGASTNILVFKVLASVPVHGALGAGLAFLAFVAFLSGVVLAGLLGWSLLRSLQLAGAVGAQCGAAPPKGACRGGKALGIVALTLALIGTIAFLAKSKSDSHLAHTRDAPTVSAGTMTTP
ncbi:MAG: hypothetical protein C4523_19965 [Myxococcales bacterium]|nr:MAG: hypothetical protein C4523_19965 [Myxococcales bacterium]